MKNRYLYLLISILILFTVTDELQGQKIRQINVDDLEKLLKNNENKLYVVNFWATWCAPCIKEMPLMEKVAGGLDTTKVKFVFISLDFPSQVKSHLAPYLERNKYPSEVSLMMNTDYDSWINKVDHSWQGGIPATLLFNNPEKKRYFHSGEVDESGLRKMINDLL